MRALVALALLAGCVHLTGPAGAIVTPGSPPMLYCVDHDAAGACQVYRSGQPTAAELGQLGVRADLKLNTAVEAREHVPAGVELLEHPWSPVGPVDHEDVAAALYDLEHAPRPTLIHCSHGVDRTGLLVALWRVLHEHVLPAAAWGEWRAFPRERTDGLFYDAFERETGWRIPEAER